MAHILWYGSYYIGHELRVKMIWNSPNFSVGSKPSRIIFNQIRITSREYSMRHIICLLPIFKSSDSKYGPFWTWHALPIVFYWNFSSFRFLSDKNWFIYQNSKFFCLLFVLVHESASCHWSRFGSLPKTQGESRHVKVQIRIKVHLRWLLNTTSRRILYAMLQPYL